jgi:hypothetical protein
MAPDVMAAMRAVKAKDGIPIAVQMDRAIRAWLKARGVPVKSERKRADTRKRS